jgi:ribonuclease BN (tRNA processing enzyme)
MSEVIFIGTSDAFGAGGRRQSALLVRGGSGSVLIDCGTTTNTGFADLDLDRNEVDAIVVSHFHADHFGGVPLFVLAARYIDQRKTPLVIAGPPETEARVRTLAAAMGHPMDDDPGFQVTFQELPPGSCHAVGPAQIESFETQHNLEAHPHGYRIQCGTHTVAYSGDTGWFPELPRRVAGADLFICECTQHQAALDFHLSLEELEAHRDEFDCGRQMLTHLGSEMSALRGALTFDTADDGTVVTL